MEEVKIQRKENIFFKERAAYQEIGLDFFVDIMLTGIKIDDEPVEINLGENIETYLNVTFNEYKISYYRALKHFGDNECDNIFQFFDVGFWDNIGIMELPLVCSDIDKGISKINVSEINILTRNIYENDKMITFGVPKYAFDKFESAKKNRTNIFLGERNKFIQDSDFLYSSLNCQMCMYLNEDNLREDEENFAVSLVGFSSNDSSLMDYLTLYGNQYNNLHLIERLRNWVIENDLYSAFNTGIVCFGKKFVEETTLETNNPIPYWCVISENTTKMMNKKISNRFKVQNLYSNNSLPEKFDFVFPKGKRFWRAYRDYYGLIYVNIDTLTTDIAKIINCLIDVKLNDLGYKASIHCLNFLYTTSVKNEKLNQFLTPLLKEMKGMSINNKQQKQFNQICCEDFNYFRRKRYEKNIFYWDTHVMFNIMRFESYYVVYSVMKEIKLVLSKIIEMKTKLDFGITMAKNANKNDMAQLIITLFSMVILSSTDKYLNFSMYYMLTKKLCNTFFASYIISSETIKQLILPLKIGTLSTFCALKDIVVNIINRQSNSYMPKKEIIKILEETNNIREIITALRIKLKEKKISREIEKYIQGSIETRNPNNFYVYFKSYVKWMENMQTDKKLLFTLYTDFNDKSIKYNNNIDFESINKFSNYIEHNFNIEEGYKYFIRFSNQPDFIKSSEFNLIKNEVPLHHFIENNLMDMVSLLLYNVVGENFLSEDAYFEMGNVWGYRDKSESFNADAMLIQKQIWEESIIECKHGEMNRDVINLIKNKQIKKISNYDMGLFWESILNALGIEQIKLMMVNNLISLFSDLNKNYIYKKDSSEEYFKDMDFFNTNPFKYKYNISYFDLLMLCQVLNINLYKFNENTMNISQLLKVPNPIGGILVTLNWIMEEDEIELANTPLFFDLYIVNMWKNSTWAKSFEKYHDAITQTMMNGDLVEDRVFFKFENSFFVESEYRVISLKYPLFSHDTCFFAFSSFASNFIQIEGITKRREYFRDFFFLNFENRRVNNLFDIYQFFNDEMRYKFRSDKYLNHIAYYNEAFRIVNYGKNVQVKFLTENITSIFNVIDYDSYEQNLINISPDISNVFLFQSKKIFKIYNDLIALKDKNNKIIDLLAEKYYLAKIMVMKPVKNCVNFKYDNVYTVYSLFEAEIPLSFTNYYYFSNGNTYLQSEKQLGIGNGESYFEQAHLNFKNVLKEKVNEYGVVLLGIICLSKKYLKNIKFA